LGEVERCSEDEGGGEGECCAEDKRSSWGVSVLYVMLGGESALKSFITRPGFDICAEINGFFLECQAYALNLLAA